MTFQEFLAAVGATAHLDVAEAVAAGGCTLQFDGAMDVTLEHDELAGAVHLHAMVLAAAGSGTARERMLALLLQLHRFGVATGGCFFCLDPDLDQVTLMRTISLAGLDDAQAVGALEGFVGRLEGWRPRLLRASQQLARGLSPLLDMAQRRA